MKSYNMALVKFMEKKARWLEEELSIPGTWYFSEADRDEIMQWDGAEAEKIWKKIRDAILRHNCSGLRYEFCPFCHKYEYQHIECSKVVHNPSCLLCSYGKNHGICTDPTEGVSDYRNILKAFEDDRIDIHRFFSNSYYRELISELENLVERNYLHPMNEHHYD